MTLHTSTWMTAKAAQAAIAEIVAALPPNARMGVLIAAALPHAGNDDLQDVLRIVLRIEDAADPHHHWEASARLASAARDVALDCLPEVA